MKHSPTSYEKNSYYDWSYHLVVKNNGGILSLLNKVNVSLILNFIKNGLIGVSLNLVVEQKISFWMWEKYKKREGCWIVFDLKWFLIFSSTNRITGKK